MPSNTEAIKKRLITGVIRRNEIIRLIEKGVDTSYAIAKRMDLDAGTVKHHLDWLENKGVLKSKSTIVRGRARKAFELVFPAETLERVMAILDLVDVDLEEAENRIVNLVQEVVEELENEELSFEDADRIFTALLALKNVEFSENTEELLTIANELHDGNGKKIATLKVLTSKP